MRDEEDGVVVARRKKKLAAAGRRSGELNEAEPKVSSGSAQLETTFLSFSFEDLPPNHAKMKTVAAYLLVRSPEAIFKRCKIVISPGAWRCHRGDSCPEEPGAGPGKGGRRRRSRVGGGGCSSSSFDRGVLFSRSLSCLPSSLSASLALEFTSTTIPQAQLGGNASPKAADIEKILSSGECEFSVFLIPSASARVGRSSRQG